MLKYTTLLLIAVLGTFPLAAKDSFSLKVEKKTPPEKLNADIKAKIAPVSHQISDNKGLFFEFWFVKEIPLRGFADTTQKTMNKINEISLLGAAIVYENKEEYTDFREDPIDPGLYVMRLSLQPQDGNHLGTSPYDTFAILIPYKKDAEVLEFMDPEVMVEIAGEDTPAEHPPILSLQPMEKAEGSFPRLEHNEEEAWNSLCLKLSGKVGDEKREMGVKLVFEGIGDL
ncbi:MAG: hypothetical protein IIC50_09160 [Planctomycetes bacterium]|nr:hypothetical protein [Planctomycetota bacterium]